MTRRVLVVLGVLVGLAMAAAPSSYAVVGAEPAAPNWCFRANADGDLPTCTWNGTRWIRTYEGGMNLNGPDGSGGGGFVAFFVLALLVGLAILVYKVSLARRMAERAGMDQDEATAMTLLSDDGLDATYLASNLRGPGTTPPPVGTTPPPTRSAEERLRELASLRDQGLLTPEEYDARRAAVLDSI